MSEFSLDFDLCYNQESRILSLVLKPAFDTTTLSKEALLSCISESEFASFYILTENIERLLTEANSILDKGQLLYSEMLSKQHELTESSSDSPETEEPAPSSIEDKTKLHISAEDIFAKLGEIAAEFDIAECQDSEINIGIDEDNLHAFISITPPFGGSAADEADIRNALKDKGIVYGISDTVVSEALSQPSCEDLLIASGTKPKKGKESRFRALVSEQITTGPKINEKGRANYHDINEFVIVEPGTALMERTLPGRGKPGTDIFGKVIPPIPGDILPFSADLTGSCVSQESNNILVATMKGHPVISDRGVSVSNVLMLRNVGLSTGNIDFDGSVCVEEDVADGVNIDISGDLTVKGVVGKVNIKAGGNVVILQGLLGGSKDAQSEEEDPYGAHIDAKGSVSAHFMTRAHIRAGKHIVVPEYVSHCDLFAKHQILVGQASGKGNLFGGRAEAFDLVAAKVIGSTGGTPTKIKVGAEGENIIKLRRISKEKRLNDQNTCDVNEALHKISLLAKSAGMTPQMKEKVEKLSSKLESLKSELQKLKTEEEIKILLMKSKKSRVLANQKIFNNTTVSILGSEKTIKEESAGGGFRFDARRVIFEN